MQRLIVVCTLRLAGLSEAELPSVQLRGNTDRLPQCSSSHAYRLNACWPRAGCSKGIAFRRATRHRRRRALIHRPPSRDAEPDLRVRPGPPCRGSATRPSQSGCARSKPSVLLSSDSRSDIVSSSSTSLAARARWPPLLESALGQRCTWHQEEKHLRIASAHALCNSWSSAAAKPTRSDCT
ncbi:hypothetical protein BKA63DRAFT_163188 [Paraphoma chrysanthemicola]|nr:hypothetical protein BKA63DRAFT_163188 [Paraphoma chrysanthemicola]